MWPQPNPEVLAAAKAITAAAAKWGNVADLLTFWGVPVVFGLGVLVGMLLMLLKTPPVKPT